MINGRHDSVLLTNFYSADTTMEISSTTPHTNMSLFTTMNQFHEVGLQFLQNFHITSADNLTVKDEVNGLSGVETVLIAVRLFLYMCK